MISAFKLRRPWAAVVVFLVLGPTIGMFYLGKGRTGLIYLALTLAAAIAAAGLVISGTIALDIQSAANLSTYVVVLPGALHGYLAARPLAGQIPRVWFARWYSWIGLFIATLAVPLLWRTFAFEPFSIPSTSMLPTLKVGDTLFVEKFAYGYSRYSAPIGLPLIRGRIFEADPNRGDLVVFKGGRDGSDYVKRIVGLPGDHIQMRDGVLTINGAAVSRTRIEDYVGPATGGDIKTVSQYVEKLPNGVSYRVLEIEADGPLDNSPVYVVPADDYFVLGDNRDNSADSRIPLSQFGLGYIPKINLIGRITTIFWNEKDKRFQWRDPE